MEIGNNTKKIDTKLMLLYANDFDLNIFARSLRTILLSFLKLMSINAKTFRSATKMIRSFII